MSLPCMNCQQPVADEGAKFYQGTLVCGTCHTMAERLYTRAHDELNNLLLMLREGIRIAIIERRLQFREGTDGPELSKKEVLAAIVRLQEMRDARALATTSGTTPGSEP